MPRAASRWDGTNHVVSDNDILENRETGIYIAVTAAIDGNNIYGNGTYGVFPGLQNCGIMLAGRDLEDQRHEQLLGCGNRPWGRPGRPGLPGEKDRSN